MRQYRLPVLTLGFVLAAAAPSYADDAADARALVDKAIKAHGGAEALAKYKAAVMAFKGTYHGMGMELPMAGTISALGADRLKVEVEVDAGGQKFKFASVLAGDKGWTRLGDAVTEMGKDDVAEATEAAHAGWLASLAPLADAKRFTLAAAGEAIVDDKPALGVKVSAKGRKDVTLYFDKATGLLVRYDHTVRAEGTGQEVTEENYPGGYKDLQGTKQAMKFTTKRDGKLHVEGEMTDLQLHETLDEGVFAKP